MQYLQMKFQFCLQGEAQFYIKLPVYKVYSYYEAMFRTIQSLPFKADVLTNTVNKFIINNHNTTLMYAFPVMRTINEAYLYNVNCVYIKYKGSHISKSTSDALDKFIAHVVSTNESYNDYSIIAHNPAAFYLSSTISNTTSHLSSLRYSDTDRLSANIKSYYGDVSSASLAQALSAKSNKYINVLSQSNISIGVALKIEHYYNSTLSDMDNVTLKNLKV